MEGGSGFLPRLPKGGWGGGGWWHQHLSPAWGGAGYKVHPISYHQIRVMEPSSIRSCLQQWPRLGAFVPPSAHVLFRANGGLPTRTIAHALVVRYLRDTQVRIGLHFPLRPPRSFFPAHDRFWPSGRAHGRSTLRLMSTICVGRFNRARSRAAIACRIWLRQRDLFWGACFRGRGRLYSS